MRFFRGILIAGFTLGCASASLADSEIGCGLGTQLWEGQSGLAPRVLGATTNGTSGNQTFGITSGTLGCSSEGVITASARTSMFASANIDRLAREMAMGDGESLDTLAHLIGVDDADKPAFKSLAQSHFGEIFADDATTAGDMLAALERLMAEDARLAKYATL